MTCASCLPLVYHALLLETLIASHSETQKLQCLKNVSYRKILNTILYMNYDKLYDEQLYYFMSGLRLKLHSNVCRLTCMSFESNYNIQPENI